MEPSPFRPVLRGLLLTGGGSRYLRTDLSATAGDSSTSSDEALWWPPSQIAGRWLAPYLAVNNEELKAPPGLAVEADLTAIQVRAMTANPRGET